MKQMSRFDQQSGAALLAFVLLLVTGSAYLLIANINNSLNRSAKHAESINALAEAKQALIAYAVNYYESNPGYFGVLPCPDLSATNEEGNQNSPCGTQHVNSIGKLPWQTLGIEPLKDAYGQCLWYAVSGAYKGGSTRPLMLNEDSHGTFRVMAADGTTILAGTTPEERPVAVIFAPGRPVSTQNRPAPAMGTICGGDYIAGNYLDTLSSINNAVISATADQIDQFIMTNKPDDDYANNFNDLLVYITADEIWDAVKKRNDFVNKFYDVTDTDLKNLTRKVTECLADFATTHSNPSNYSMPWPAPISFSSPDDYRYNDDYTDVDDSANILSGRLPNIITNSNNEINDTSPKPNLFSAANTNDIFCTDFNGQSDAGDTLTPSEEDELRVLWENWKDHLFYAVSDAYKPRTGATLTCLEGARCIMINANHPPNNDTRDMSAVVIFSNSIMAGQARSAPPIDSDQKGVITNYLEGANNPVSYVDTASNDTKRYDYIGGTGAINDILYCINDEDGTDFEVTICTDS